MNRFSRFNAASVILGLAFLYAPIVLAALLAAPRAAHAQDESAESLDGAPETVARELTRPAR